MADLTIMFIAIILVLIALCVWLWIKYRSEKKARWDETFYQTCLNARIADLKEKNNYLKYDNDWLQSSNKHLNAYCKQRFEENVNLLDEKNQLQDKLSSILCQHNDHVWVDGKCKKCGRKRSVKNT